MEAIARVPTTFIPFRRPSATATKQSTRSLLVSLERRSPRRPAIADRRRTLVRSQMESSLTDPSPKVRDTISILQDCTPYLTLEILQTLQLMSRHGAESFLRATLSSMEGVYLSRNPTARAILDLVRSHDGGTRISYDHFAFRTFGVDGYGIDSMAKLFLDYGYRPRDELRFPAKKLRALWFAPPSAGQCDSGSSVDGPLPRIFISELLVDEISSKSQEIITKYIRTSCSGSKYAALASALGSLTWNKPSYSDYEHLSRESEYAAWTLVNGYALNHATISTHHLKSHIRSIESLNKFIEDQGFKLNSEGGVLKVSPDGLLLQSSTVADSTSFTFADGVTESVPCSYIEFAERLLLPQYKNIPDEEVKEFHRRDGFEVGNADKIFESTSKDQLTRKAA